MARDLELKLKITADGKVAVEQLGAVDGALQSVDQEARRAAGGIDAFAAKGQDASKSLSTLFGSLRFDSAAEAMVSTDAVVQLLARLGSASEETGEQVRATARDVAEGRIGAEQVAAGLQELDARLGTIAVQTREIEQAFRDLGITSSESLRQAALRAQQAFEAIRDSEETTLADRQRAWEAYAAKAVASGDAVIMSAAREASAVLGLYDRYEELAGKKDAAGAATRRLAEEQSQLGEIFRAAGIQGVDSMEAVRAAIARLTDAGELQALGDALREAFAQGVLGAEEYQQALEEVRAKQGQLKEESRKVVVDQQKIFEQIGNDYGRFVALNAGLREIPGALQKAWEDYVAWMEENVERLSPRASAPTRATTRASAAPSAPAPARAPAVERVASPAPVTTNNVSIQIEGVLDVNDRVTLESLARKLKPVLADLARRGVA